MKVTVIIPALNEERSIGKVIEGIPKEVVTEIVVADNGSTDRTAEFARKAGARVVEVQERGYGAACLGALATVMETDVIVFVDGDNSDYPEEIPLLVAPIGGGEADLVIGSRVLGEREVGALQPQQRFGNALATFLIGLFYRVRFTDLGPFRAITWSALQRLNMEDRDYGWTVEMQVKAARAGLRCTEVPVRYRKRTEGVSKVSGSLIGSLRAGFKIILTILRHVFRNPGR